MSDTVIRVENLGKKYIIGHQKQQPYKTLRDVMAEGAKSLKGKLLKPFGKSITNPYREEFWALKDVSFEIKQGEVVGIIGRNGAGKSTLLKMLSRITEPTTGIIEIKGRVASLLEVGTGFHPELTGRENIYLNGAILGMSKAEIRKKFDEIVTFAEVEKFLDTPVKYYSSGMYVRLAFAVASHLEPEILLVDEVLAVGDIEFQKKCMGKMENVAAGGRTVLVVSHNMITVKALCTRGILLEKGIIKGIGQIDPIVTQYISSKEVDSFVKIISDTEHLMGGKKVRINKITLLNYVANSFSVYWQQPISISVEIEVFEKCDEVSFGAGIKTVEGTWIFCVHHDDYDVHSRWTLVPGKHLIEFTLKNYLNPGIYKLCVGAHHHHYLKNLCHVEAVNIQVLDHSENGLVPLVYNPGQIQGFSTWQNPVLLQ